MGTTARAWFDALRLRTLPLSLSGVVIASGLAGFYHVFNPLTCTLMLVMAALLQILSNFADEYGDLAHGADNEDRIGPKRGLQRGDITAPQMKGAIIVCAATAVAFAVALLATSFSSDQWAWVVGYLVLMAACVAAAVLYTMGKRPYGYYGLGDLSCFLFFGLVPVVGGFILFAARAGAPAFVPATVAPGFAIGALSAGTLNLNNMRDIETDKAAGKLTLAVKLGPQRALGYHVVLLVVGLCGFLAFSILTGESSVTGYLYLVVYLLFARLMQQIISVGEPTGYDRCMKPWSMAAALLSLAFALCVALG